MLAPMKDSEVALQAAERIDSGMVHLSCLVLESMAPGRSLSEEYTKLFAPRQDSNPGEQWLFFAPGLGSFREKNEWRVTALCLFAAILAAEGR